MFIVGEAVIDEAVAQARFSCDLAQCKGACCTLPGGRGAPLMDSELEELQRATPFAAKYLSEEHRRIAARYGVFPPRPVALPSGRTGARSQLTVACRKRLSR